MHNILPLAPSKFGPALREFTYNSPIVNWLDRLRAPLGNSLLEKKLLVHPCVIDGQRAIVYTKGLQQHNPVAYQQLVDFAELNGFRLKEDQRGGFKSVRNERRAKVMPMMLLGASMLGQQVYAAGTKSDTNMDDLSLLEVTSSHRIGGHYESDMQMLVADLLNWVNSHSTFTYSMDELPEIKQVSVEKMAAVAFGENMPKNLDLSSFQIYGLYNFEEKAVYILDSLDLTTDKGKGILLHELVHFLQYKYGHDKSVQCKNELESMAYLLEAKYLTAHNHKHGLKESKIRRISQCAGQA